MDLETLQLPPIDMTSQGQPNSVPAFLNKLRNLLDDPKNEHLICWDETGLSFHLYEQTAFAKEILPKYFKHNNLASFIRQLNMYGFKKIATIEHGGLNSKDDMEFENPNFVRDEPERIKLIKRKGSSIREKLGEYRALQPAQVNNVLVDVRDLKMELDSMSATLQLVKAENAALWSHMSKIRQQHEQQQSVLNKVLSFMMSFANASQKRKRNLPMIALGPSNKMKAATSTYDVTPASDTPSKTLSDSGHSMTSSAGNAGITIKDITDDDLESEKVLHGDEEFTLPSEFVSVEFPEASNEQSVSNAMVALPSNTTNRDPKLFKTQFSESVDDVQSDLDLLRDLFSNSESLGLTPDALENLFEGNNDLIYYNNSPTSPVDLGALVDSSPSAGLPGLGMPSNQVSLSGDAALQLQQQTALEGLIKEINSRNDEPLNTPTLDDILPKPLASDDEGEHDAPIISSLDLD